MRLMAIKFYVAAILSLMLCLGAYGQEQTPTLPTPEELIQKIDAPTLPAKKLFWGANLISANIHYNDTPTTINGAVIKDADIFPDFAIEYRFFLRRQIDETLAASVYFGAYHAEIEEGRNITDLRWDSGNPVVTYSEMRSDALGILLHKQFKIFGNKQNKKLYGNLGYRLETRTAKIRLYDGNILRRDGEVTQNLAGIEAEAGIDFVFKHGKILNLGYVTASGISGLNIGYRLRF